MSTYTVNDIHEILVTLTDGRQFIYIDKGIQNLKRTLNTPLPPGTTRSKVANNIKIIDTDEGSRSHRGDSNRKSSNRREENIGSAEEEEEGEDEIFVEKSSKDGRARDVTQRPATSNGYNVVPLSYTPAKGGQNPMDMAKDLQRQAEASSGVRY
jgi:hypothetical protein